MQIKIILGICAVVMTVFVFAYAILREPSRMVVQSAAFEAHQIEEGAELYQTHCATCHGEKGWGEECYSAINDELPCAGISLSDLKFACTEPIWLTPDWYSQMKSSINTKITVGNPKHELSVTGIAYGGSLTEPEIESLVAFLWNREAGNHFHHLCYFTPTPYTFPRSVAGLPQGNVEAGAQLYDITYGCAACHGSKDIAGSNAVGPWGGEWVETVGTRKEGYTAADYLYESILLPSAFIAPDCPTGPCAGPPSGMPLNYGHRMSPQDIADVIAYLLDTAEFESHTTVSYP